MPQSPPHEKKHEKCGSKTESSERALGGPGGHGAAVVPTCRPTHTPRAFLGSLFGVAMFLKRCDPSGLCSASNGIRAGGLDDGRYGSEELGPLRSPQVGAAEERGTVVTLHSGQSCRGTPGLRGSTAGTGPAGTGGWVSEGSASGYPNTLPRALTAAGRP